MTQITAPSPDGSAPGPVTSFGYDYRGRRMSVTDANSKVTTYAYDDADRLTSVTDAAANVTTYTYDTFGNLAASSGSVVNPFRYTAREWDSETGLYFYRARYYHGSVGRFVSEDPIAFQGGLNFFAYVSNRPTVRMDPFGLDDATWERIRKAGLNLLKVALIVRALGDSDALSADLHATRVQGHQRFPGEINSAMRHCAISCELAMRWPPDLIRVAGGVNEVQGLRFDVLRIWSRLRGQTPEAFQLEDLKNNERGFACAERTFFGKFPSCEQCCASAICAPKGQGK